MYIPDRMMDGITRYIEQGVPPGDFLRAIICNDLAEAVGRADDENLVNIPAYVAYFYNEAPGPCWHSSENMAEWIAIHAAKRAMLAVARDELKGEGK
jgi:hypothetical protein